MLEKLLPGWRHKFNRSPSNCWSCFFLRVNVWLHLPNCRLSVRPVWYQTHTHEIASLWAPEYQVCLLLKPEINSIPSHASINWEINEGGCWVTESLKDLWWGSVASFCWTKISQESWFLLVLVLLCSKMQHCCFPPSGLVTPTWLYSLFAPPTHVKSSRQSSAWPRFTSEQLLKFWVSDLKTCLNLLNEK